MFRKMPKRTTATVRLIQESAQFALESLEARQLLSAPLNPTGLAVASATSSTLTLSWQDNSNNETGFGLERLINGNWSTIANLGVDATSYTDTGLAANTAYAYRVHAFNASGNSAYSFIGNAVTLAAGVLTPNAPFFLSAVANSSSKVSLSWSDNTGVETGVNVERQIGNGAFSVIATLAPHTASYADTTVSGSTFYTYRVAAFNTAGSSPYSNITSVITPAGAPTPPAAPTMLTTTANSTSQITLNWVDNSNNETGFNVERQNGASWTLVTTTAAHATSYADTGLTPNTAYTYRVSAVNAAGTSAPTNTSTATTQQVVLPTPPAAPTLLTTTPNSQSQITLNWTDNSNNETGFNIERQNGAGWTPVITVGAGVTTYADTGLAANTAYTYRVNAVNAAGPSAYTNTSTATTLPVVAQNPPLAPFFLSATINASSQVSLVWADNTGAETGVNVERQLGNGVFSVVATLAPHAASFVDIGAPGSSFLTYRIAAFNSGGSSPYSNISSVITPAGTVTPTPPAAPTGLSTTANSTSQITLNWTDNSNNETGFLIERQNGASWTAVTTTAAGVTSFADTGLAPNTAYTYRVSAVNAAGTSAPTNTSTATTQQVVTPPNVPAAPTNLTTTADLSTQITLRWTDNSNNETGFNIERLNGSTWVPLTSVAADTTVFSDANLSPNTAYSYRVYAVNASGASGYTNTSTATTPPTVLPNVPAAPSALSAVQISNTKMSLVWTDNSNNETGFHVERWNGATWVPVTTLPAASTYYIDSGLTASTPYTYRVNAFNANGPSAYANSSTGTTNPTNAAPPRTDLTTFFPIGVFQQPTYTMSTWKQRGVNTMVGFESYGAVTDMATWTQVANDNGLKYMRQPSANPASDINDPNLLSWLYPIDEPDLSDLATALPGAQAEFNLLRAIDPTRPIATTYAGGYMLNWLQGVRDQAYYETMTQYTDWVMPCIYPVTGWNQPNNLNAVGQLVDRVNQWFPGKRNIAYIETSNQNLGWVGPQERGVTPDEYRGEVWDAVIHGATGIVYFPHSLNPFNYDNTPADVAAEMTVQDARLSKFGAALLSAQNPTGTSLSANGSIETAWRVYNGHTYYFALNLSPNAVNNVSLNTTGLSASQTLTVDGENRNVTLQNGTLIDSFKPYEAHIYVV